MRVQVMRNTYANDLCLGSMKRTWTTQMQVKESVIEKLNAMEKIHYLTRIESCDTL